MSAGLRTLLLALPTAAALLAAGCGGEDQSAACVSRAEFAERWAKAQAAVDEQSEPTDLQILADSLIDCHTIDGWSYDTVKRRLGRPNTAYTRPGFNLAYYVGSERSSPGIDSEWLGIAFDENGTFTRMELYTD